MGFFGKNMPKAAKKGIVKIALLIVGICAFISMPVVLSLGWFASNNNTTANGMQVVVATDTYDILVDRSLGILYDPAATDAESQELYPNLDALMTELSNNGYDLAREDALQLGIELRNDLSSASGGHNLFPGSYGTATFFIRPHDPLDTSTITFSLRLTGYRDQYDAENHLSIVPATNATALNMLHGHILLFASRTGADHNHYQYDGLLSNGELAFTMNGGAGFVSGENYYEVTIYWEWPVTYDDITENTSTTSPAVTKKYPAALTDYVSGHPQYFFASGASAVTSGQEIDSYNDGDQLIGDNIKFVAVFIN